METKSKRLTSLDFFRGATVAAMIIVNEPGNWDTKYYQLSHAEWEGCTMTDLIFPFFLFIVGVSIVLAYNKALGKGMGKKDLLKKTLKRAAIIFLLGLFLSLFPNFNFQEFRIPGVLQRIALVYLFCSMIFLFADKRSHFIWFGGILVGYYIIMMFLPVPGIGPANLDPINNFSAWFDRFILEGYIGSRGQGQYDSTGIFTTIPSVASGLAGILVGNLLAEKKKEQNEKLIWMFIFGCLSMAVGWAFSYEFPIIKRLWTSSFVLYTAGIATICFATSYWLLDVKNRQKYIKPFLAFGVNALAAYFGAALLGQLASVQFIPLNGSKVGVREWLFNEVLTSILNPYNASLAYAILNTSVIFILVWYFYKKNIIIKV
ncbi:acyltransferase family protein [Flagellimonas marina]|uniref:Acyltransferase family protein n=1 Tax=Flagellimonas marina TaxID=1775168 RepID=A0ABV8PQK2_9FLAO